MTSESFFPIVYAGDLDAALAFYEGLGLSPTYRWPPDGDADFVVLRLGERALGVAAASAPEALLGLRPGDPIRFELCFYVDDVDETFREFSERGVRVLRSPADMPWGERMAYVADPDGNPIQITSRH